MDWRCIGMVLICLAGFKNARAADCCRQSSENGVLGEVALPFEVLSAKLLPLIPSDQVKVSSLRFGSPGVDSLFAVISTTSPWAADIAFDFRVENPGPGSLKATAPVLTIFDTRVLGCDCGAILTKGIIMNLGLRVVRGKLESFLNTQIKDFLDSLARREELKDQDVRFHIGFCPMELVATGYTGSLRNCEGMVRENLSEYSASGKLRVDADVQEYAASGLTGMGEVVIYFNNRRSVGQVGFNVLDEGGMLVNSTGRIDAGQAGQVSLPLEKFAGKWLKVKSWFPPGIKDAQSRAGDEARFMVTVHGSQNLTISAFE